MEKRIMAVSKRLVFVILLSFLCSFCGGNVVLPDQNPAGEPSAPLIGDNNGSHTDQCAQVKNRYVQINHGDPQHVPSRPTPETELSVCFNGLEPGRTCCSGAMEEMYMKLSEGMFTDHLEKANYQLTQLIKNGIENFENDVLALIKNSEKNTMGHLSEIYRIPWSEHHKPVNKLFASLFDYVKQGQVEIPIIVNEFFDQLLPLVFRYAVNDPTVTNYKESLNDCLIKLRRHLHPQPFGTFSRKMAHELSTVLWAARSYLHALSVVSDTINATNHLDTEETCKKGITQMLFCSQCKGHVGVKPCKDFCQDVMHSCFSKQMEVSYEWDEIVRLLRQLTRYMVGPSGLESVLKNIDRVISDGIMNAMDKAPEFTPTILVTCKETGSAPENQKVSVQSPLVPNNKMLISDQEPVSSISLKDQATQLLLSLLNIHGVYRNITSSICVDFNVSQSPTHCWNGSHVAQYQQITSKYHSPNIRVSFVNDRNIMSLKDKLLHIQQNLISRTAEDDQMQNDAYIYQGSGASMNTYRDDEDFFAGSGSGSGYTPKNVHPDSSASDGFTIDSTPSTNQFAPKPNGNSSARSLYTATRHHCLAFALAIMMLAVSYGSGTSYLFS
ncbi:glypican-3 [Octopus bimaculoides]|uniref:glypican-3 n=1 Tax=Octopus bimaculoides TaxID=37653 RepID=UPI00071C9777|nr:glypican-3 [Octopus bimaculoides]|eukprot:XP_014774973.1 PREDICTED: glypican-3-like [Octopus bimaculoides]